MIMTKHLAEMTFPFDSQKVADSAYAQMVWWRNYGSASRARDYLALTNAFCALRSGTTVWLTAEDIDYLALGRDPGP